MRAVLLAAALLASAPALAQGPTGAASPGSPQRRAILDALRPPVERQLRGPVEFVVDRIRVYQGYALVFAQPQRPGGGRIDGARYFPDFENMDGLTVTAVLRFSGGRWRLIDHAIGATDAWYCGDRRIAPAALLGC